MSNQIQKLRWFSGVAHLAAVMGCTAMAGYFLLIDSLLASGLLVGFATILFPDVEHGLFGPEGLVTWLMWNSGDKQ